MCLLSIPNNAMERFLKTVLLIALGIFLYSRVLGDSILFYINQRFVSLTLLAAVGFILVGASYLLATRREHGDGHDDHDHGALSWPGLLILALPVVLGWLVPPQPLGASALGNREINVGGSSSLSSISAPRSNEATMGVISGEKNIVDWLREFERAPDPAGFAGEEVHVIGFVYRDQRFAEDRFMVGRYIVSCCVADASPVGLVVQWPEGAALAADQWVEVGGRFDVGTFDGVEMPIIVAEDVTLTDPPPQPYLYP